MRLTNRTKELINNEKVNAKNKLLKFIFAVPFWLILASLVLMAFGICRAVYLTDSRPDQHIAEQIICYFQAYELLCKRDQS